MKNFISSIIRRDKGTSFTDRIRAIPVRGIGNRLLLRLSPEELARHKSRYQQYFDTAGDYVTAMGIDHADIIGAHESQVIKALLDDGTILPHPENSNVQYSWQKKFICAKHAVS